MPSANLDPIKLPPGIDPPSAYSLFVAHPPEVRLAVVHCATTKGNIQITQRGAETSTQLIRPDSPLYNLTNAACAAHLSCAIGDATAPSTTVAITCTNNTGDEGQFDVAVALDYVHKTHEIVSTFSGKIPKGASCFVFVVFHTVATDTL